jgi:hypothetical protein
LHDRGTVAVVYLPFPTGARGPTASAATLLIEFDFDQIVGGEIRADGAGAAPKRINI